MSDPMYVFGALVHHGADRRMRERLEMAERRRMARRLRTRGPGTRRRVRHLAGRIMVRAGWRLLRTAPVTVTHDEGARA